MCFSPQRRTIFQHLNFKKCSRTLSSLTFSLLNVLFAQQRAIFQHLNFKKCSRTVSFLTFSLLNVLFATAAYNFSTSQLQKVLGAPHVLCIFTSKCAFRHSGVQFLMSPLTTYLRTRRFNGPTFRLTRHTNPRENTAFRDFSNIWRGCIFFLLTFALLHLLPSDLTACLMMIWWCDFLRWCDFLNWTRTSDIEWCQVVADCACSAVQAHRQAASCEIRRRLGRRTDAFSKTWPF